MPREQHEGERRERRRRAGPHARASDARVRSPPTHQPGSSARSARGSSARRRRSTSAAGGRRRAARRRRTRARRASRCGAASRGCRRRRGRRRPSRRTPSPAPPDSSTSPEVSHVSAAHTRASASGYVGAADDAVARRRRRGPSSGPSTDQRPPRASRRSPPGAKRSSPAAPRIAPSRGAGRHMTRSTPSSAAAASTRRGTSCVAALGQQRVDHRRALRRAQRDLGLVVARAARRQEVEVVEGAVELDAPLDRRVRVVGDDDHRVLVEERVGAAARRGTCARAGGRRSRST